MHFHGNDVNRQESEIAKKKKPASHPSFFCFSIFLFQRCFKESITALYDHIENVVGTRFQIVIWGT